MIYMADTNVCPTDTQSRQECKLPNPLGRQECLPHYFMGYWQNKVALVTGGSSGLGRVIAEAFAAAGANVAIVGLEADAVRQAADEMRSAGRDVLGIHADITRQPDVDRLLAETLDRFGRLDVLVNNAGRSMRGKVLDTTPEQFRDLMELNLIALVRCTRAAVPHLLPQRGHVVNIGSLAAKSAARWVGAYPATKFAVAAYASSCGWNWGRKGCTCCWFAPARSSARTPGCIRWKGWKTCPSRPKAGRRRAGAGHPAATACPGDPSGLRAPPAGIGHSRQGPAAVRPFATLADSGRLDRAAEEWSSLASGQWLWA